MEKFRFSILVERGEDEVVGAGQIPVEAIPQGFVWIPAAEFYRGGYGTGHTRYRKAPIGRAFIIEELEATVGFERGAPVWELISHRDATRACESWQSDGWKAAVPLEEQWEFAGRGAAGRLFPWGDRFDAEAAGDRGADRSIVGVAALAGGVMEWSASPAEAQDTFVTKGANAAYTEDTEFALGAVRWRDGRVGLPDLGFRRAAVWRR